MDAQGKFKIPTVDPSLVFTLLVAADGHKPAYFKKQDPKTGELSLQLERRLDAPPAKNRYFRAQLIGPDHQPVASAPLVAVNYDSKEVDTLAVSNEKGEFTLHSQTDFTELKLRVTPEKHARQNITVPAWNGQCKEFQLSIGATLKGRVVQAGKPVAGLHLGTAQIDRSSETFMSDFVTQTDADGRFEFHHLPADQEMGVYGLLGAAGGRGALATRNVKLKGDNSTTDLGDWEMSPGFRLAGQVKKADGQPLPPHIRLVFGRLYAWDNAGVELDAEGRFDIPNVPSESLTLRVNLEGYRFAPGHASLDPGEPYNLVGQLKADKTNLLIVLEPGPHPNSNYSNREKWARAKYQPISGVEDAPAAGHKEK